MYSFYKRRRKDTSPIALLASGNHHKAAVHIEYQAPLTFLLAAFNLTSLPEAAIESFLAIHQRPSSPATVIRPFFKMNKTLKTLGWAFVAISDFLYMESLTKVIFTGVVFMGVAWPSLCGEPWARKMWRGLGKWGMMDEEQALQWWVEAVRWPYFGPVWEVF